MNDRDEQEENIPFKDLIKLKSSRTLHSDTEEYKRRQSGKESDVFFNDPYISIRSERDEELGIKKQIISDVSHKTIREPLEKEVIEEIEEEIEAPKKPKAQPPIEPEVVEKIVENKGEPKIEKQEVQEVKDETQSLKDSLESLSREQVELKQKIEYYKKNQEKVFAEKEDFLLKKDEIEKVLKPVIEQEKSIEDEIKTIELREESAKDEGDRRKIETERWTKEDERQKIERKKWVHAEDLKTIKKLIDDKTSFYETTVARKIETEARLVELGKEIELKKLNLNLLEIRKSKNEIEVEKEKLAGQIKEMENTIGDILKNEQSVILEKKDIEEKEHKASNPDEEKAMEEKRWEIEPRLRQIEQEKWKLSDDKDKIVNLLSSVEEQYKKTVNQEKEIVSKIGKISG